MNIDAFLAEIILKSNNDQIRKTLSKYKPAYQKILQAYFKKVQEEPILKFILTYDLVNACKMNALNNSCLNEEFKLTLKDCICSQKTLTYSPFLVEYIYTKADETKKLYKKNKLKIDEIELLLIKAIEILQMPQRDDLTFLLEFEKNKGNKLSTQEEKEQFKTLITLIQEYNPSLLTMGLEGIRTINGFEYLNNILEHTLFEHEEGIEYEEVTIKIQKKLNQSIYARKELAQALASIQGSEYKLEAKDFINNKNKSLSITKSKMNKIEAIKRAVNQNPNHTYKQIATLINARNQFRTDTTADYVKKVMSKRSKSNKK